ncbi:hypothetical protein D3C71_1230760 [compost metagenome]
MVKVNTSNPSFDMSGLRFHRHHRIAQHEFIVLYGVHWRHHRINTSLPCKYIHRNLYIEGLFDLVFIQALFFQNTVTVRALHSTNQQLGFIPFKSIPIFPLRSKFRLQLLHPLFLRILCILLHRHIDRRIDFQSITIEVIRCAIWFGDGQFCKFLFDFIL